MKSASKKRMKEIGKLLGVNLTIDKTLDQYSRIVPEKVKEHSELISNMKFNF